MGSIYVRTVFQDELDKGSVVHILETPVEERYDYIPFLYDMVIDI